MVAPATPKRILIVEDEESMRELLRLHLSWAGYTVEVAEDAIAAGYSVLKAPPDLLVCGISTSHTIRSGGALSTE